MTDGGDRTEEFSSSSSSDNRIAALNDPLDPKNDPVGAESLQTTALFQKQFPKMTIPEFKKLVCDEFNKSIVEANKQLAKEDQIPALKEQHIQFRSENEQPLECRIVGYKPIDKAGIFFKIDGTASLDIAKVDKDCQGHGIMRGFFPAILALRKRQPNSIQTLEMMANLTVGAYAWAKMGFVPHRPYTSIYRKAVTNIDAYLRTPAGQKLKSKQKERLRGLSRDLTGNNQDRTLIRKIAALDFKVPNAGPFRVDDQVGIQNDLTLGKSILLRQKWYGFFDFKKDEKYMEAYIGMKEANVLTKGYFKNQYQNLTWNDKK